MNRRLLYTLLPGLRRLLEPGGGRRARRSGDRIWLFLLLLGLVGYFVWHTYFRPIPEVYKAAGGLELYFAPQQGREAKNRLLGLINSAQNRIEVAALELDDREIGQALTRAAARGVRVRLFADSDYRRETRESLGVKSTSQARCETLQRVQVCYDSRNNALMHHKFVLIDERGVWTGSTNLTWNAFARNNENSLWLPVRGLVDVYRAEFDTIFAGQESGLGRFERFQIGSTEGTVYFSPAGGRKGREAILSLLKRAHREIWIAAFVLTDARIVEALVQAHRRGVRVRAVIDARNLENSRDETLKQAGIDVRKDGNPYTMHHKVMVVDGEWVVTGSYNFTSSGYGRNNENLLILRDSALAQRYLREVEANWRAGSRL
ncbi:MAG: phospholipase D-like domain-containing protein [Meiothermus sp.]|uniref:phospholipase D-like domain-containing protein n=1 Tax=Meiothermus sp. TaxID=1955249 RepID=UPI0025E5FF1D|nr:phospholipase D-like domain-containing protein [Meiothermus sp.]MCS7068522.1 phospholipase D-like domain-containing protein [Meiothermus sp.]MCX7601264.1 phospholipase D-like domain-containing protein [Meiothermus sp.]MDW8424783.1 phospholipase D-like domain-containing protein [Meiothermus sp.]